MFDFQKEFKELDIDLVFANSDRVSSSEDQQQFIAKLPKEFLNLFDTVNFKIFVNNGKFARDSKGKLIVAGVTFLQKNGSQNIDDIENFVKFILKIFNVTDDDWTDVDALRINSGVWRGRTIFQDGIVFFSIDDLGKITFELTSYNKFLERLN